MAAAPLVHKLSHRAQISAGGIRVRTGLVASSQIRGYPMFCVLKPRVQDKGGLHEGRC